MAYHRNVKPVDNRASLNGCEASSVNSISASALIGRNDQNSGVSHQKSSLSSWHSRIFRPGSIGGVNVLEKKGGGSVTGVIGRISVFFG
jgi:hypothetical protein